MAIYECDDCGMENDEASLQWDDAHKRWVCPDCGSPNISERDDEDDEANPNAR